MDYIGSEHLLLGIMASQSLPFYILRSKGLTEEKVLEWVKAFAARTKAQPTSSTAEVKETTDPYEHLFNVMEYHIKQIVDREVNKEIDAILASCVIQSGFNPNSGLYRNVAARKRPRTSAMGSWQITIIDGGEEQK